MKRIKMCIYGEPGTGKSVFACKAPKPFFICTDGNYEWLEDFGAKEEDHIQVNSWEEASNLASAAIVDAVDKAKDGDTSELDRIINDVQNKNISNDKGGR